MNKDIMLAKGHIRKNKGTSVGLFILLFLGTLLIGVSMLIIMDTYPIARKEAVRLNSGDGHIRLSDNLKGIDDKKIEELIKDDTKNYEIKHCLQYTTSSVPFGNGEMSIDLLVDDSSVFEQKMSVTEAVDVDDSIKSNYIYLPYQFFTSGGVKRGEDYSFKLKEKKYTFKVKGFLNTTYFGCNNNGSFLFVLDDESYKEIEKTDKEKNDTAVIFYELKDGIKQSKFDIEFLNKVAAINPMTVVSRLSLEDTLMSKSFMALIMVLSFIVVSVIILLVILLMLINSISNYIKENMKTIGALKAIGYTYSDIRNSLLIMFAILAIVGSILGIIVAYIIMPAMSTFVIAQMGIPYKVSFNMIATIVPVVGVIIYAILVTCLVAKRIKKIEPVVALREGMENHNFRKNHVRLDKSYFGLNFSLSLKTMFFNKRQNIITFFVTGLIIYSCTFGLLMYENFNRKPKLELLTLETCGGVVMADSEKKDDIEKYLNDRSDATNIRRVIDVYLYYNNEDQLHTYVFDDVSKMNNQNACYEGRLPKHDNEIAVSGSFGNDNGVKIGDELKLDYGDKSYKYLITGFIQTTNNGGREAILNEVAIKHLVSLDDGMISFWFDCDGEAASKNILDECSEKYGEHVLSTINFYETMEGGLTTLKTLSMLMLVTICSVSGIIIVLVLILLIKSLIYKKRKDYGIYKAVGYTSGDLIKQTALSFMPSLVLATLIFSIISHETVNSVMNIIMKTFGLMKCTFNIPIPGLIIISISLIVLAFVFALIEARKIKKIEPYNMLISE